MTQYNGDYRQEGFPSFAPEPEEATGVVHEPTKEETASARYDLALSVLKQAHESIGHVIELLTGKETALGASHLANLVTSKQKAGRSVEELSGSRVVEGVFDGFSMIGGNGKAYPVPPNYASKSRLVEGDMLKLTIGSSGKFVFKQIAPIERRRVMGKLAYDIDQGCHMALCGEVVYRLLPASVTYFKGEPGDEVMVLVPKTASSVWAAVENIVKK